MNKILPVFLPFVACKNKCIFCNQNAITNEESSSNLESLTLNQIEKWLTYSNNYDEIAFYGGNFGAIEKNKRIDLYNIAYNKGIDKIRFSTRPDTINEDLIEEIKDFKINFVELGVQSLSDEVLKSNIRPYNRNDVFNAINNLNKVTNCGIQLMTDMYKQDKFSCIDDAIDLSKLNIKTVRIYPTQVYENTYLYKLYQSGMYKESSFVDTLLTVTAMYIIFSSVNIKVIRMGLPLEALESNLKKAGVSHNSFGDLVKTLVALLYFDSGKSCNFYGYKSIVKELFSDKLDLIDKSSKADFFEICKTVRSVYFENSKWFFESKANFFAQRLKSKTNNR